MKWGVFCKKVDLSSTQGALCTVSVYFILHFTHLGGAYTHPTHPPAYGPEAIDRNDSKTQVVKQRFLDGSVAGSGRGPDVACERRAASWTTLS